MKEEEFYGEGKRERDPRRKVKEMMIREGIWDRQEGKEEETFDQRVHWKEKKKEG